MESAAFQGLREGTVVITSDKIVVLIVDDEPTKVATLIGAIAACAGDTVEILTADSFNTALAQCRANRVDLLLLDLMIPMFSGETPTPDGGRKLLQRLRRSTSGSFPTHVICVTQYVELEAEQSDDFISQDIRILRIDSTDPQWTQALESRLTDLLLSKSRGGLLDARDYKSDFCIVTALHQPEMEAVQRVFPVVRERMVPGDHRRYCYSNLEHKGRELHGVLACADEVGAAAMSSLVTSIVHNFSPRVLLLAGFAAGRQTVVSLGDVVVAECCWNLVDGKAVEAAEASPNFEKEVRQLRATPEGVALAKRWHGKKLAEIGCTTPMPMTGDERLQVCPWVTSPYVVADASEWESAEQVNRKVAALDMECYAAMYAALHATEPRPQILAIKGVADFASKTKDGAWQATASNLSAQVCRLMIQRIYDGH